MLGQTDCRRYALSPLEEDHPPRSQVSQVSVWILYRAKILLAVKFYQNYAFVDCYCMLGCCTYKYYYHCTNFCGTKFRASKKSRNYKIYSPRNICAIRYFAVIYHLACRNQSRGSSISMRLKCMPPCYKHCGVINCNSVCI